MTNTPVPMARTPLDQWHKDHGAHVGDCDGWRLPAVFTGIEQEISDARSHVGLADVSPLAKIRICGSAVPELIRRFTGNGPNVRRGRVFDLDLDVSALACVLADDEILVLASTTDALRLQDSLANRVGDRTIPWHDVTCALAGIHVLGLNSDALLRRVTHFDLSQNAFPAGSCAETSCAGIHATMVRDPEWPLPALRVYASWDLAEYLWRKLFDMGRNFGVVPVGMEAWRVMSGV